MNKRESITSRRLKRITWLKEHKALAIHVSAYYSMHGMKATLHSEWGQRFVLGLRQALPYSAKTVSCDILYGNLKLWESVSHE